MTITAGILALACFCGCAAPTRPPATPTPQGTVERVQTPAPEYRGETVDILVVGDLMDKRGLYRFRPDEPCTVFHLMLKIGELSHHTDMNRVTIIRKDPNGQRQEIRVNLRDVLHGGTENDVPLRHGDIILFGYRQLAL